MTKRGQGPMDRELIDALRADAARVPGPAVRARVFSRLEQRMAGIGAAAAGSAIGTAAEGAAAAGAKPLLLAALMHPVGIGVLAAAFGGTVTGTITALQDSNPPAAYTLPAPPPGGRPVQPLLMGSSSAPAAPSIVVPTQPVTAQRITASHAQKRHPSPVPVTQPSAAAPTNASLGEQLALLEAARKALARGENAAVLDTLEAHSGRYPESDLAEEREALAIKALVAAGKIDAAKQRGARFQRLFPKSLLLPSVTQTLEMIP